MALDIGIVGAGVGGLYAGAALAADGHNVTIFERAAAITEVGAGIQVSPNGAKLLDAVGALGDVASVAVEPPAIEFRDGLSGARFMRMPLGPAARQRWHAPYLHVHRADLIDALRRCALRHNARLILGARVEAIMADGTLRCRGASKTFDVVIAADGARSQTRSNLFEAPRPRFTGNVAWRALVDEEHQGSIDIPHGAVVWQSGGAHVVTYRVSEARRINIVAVVSGCAWENENWTTDADPDELRRRFKGWAIEPLLRGMGECWKWGLFETPPPASWRRGRVVLLGDACHPMVPFLAQGAVQAIEDGAVLARALHELPDVETALDSYGRTRHDRVVRVQRTAQANAGIFHARSTPQRAALRLAMTAISRVAPTTLMARFDWLFGHDTAKEPFK